MKKLFYFVMAVAVAIVVSCAGGPGKKLVGTWKCDGVEIANLDEVINQYLASVPDSMKEAQKKVMEEQMKLGWDKMKGALSMTFKEDKSYESSMEGKTDKGTWALSEDGKSLTVKQEGAQKEDKLAIEELTDNKLVISGDQGGAKTKMVFIK